jgi:hypothetical protein
MKNFLKDNGPGLITVAVLVISLFLALSGEPGPIIKEGAGWAIVRGITLVWSILVAIGSYSKWIYFGKGIKELVNNIKGIKSAVNTGWKHSYFQSFSLIMWVITWIICWQVMASFYVADWCANGF